MNRDLGAFLPQRGMMTLALLILLSSSLFLLLLLDDDMLHLHSALASQRAHYVTQSTVLQKESAVRNDNLCSNLAVEYTQTVYQRSFSMAKNSGVFQDENQHYIWCERQALFKKSPTKAILAGEYAQYINESVLEKLTLPNHFYWLNKEQNQWQLNGNMNAVIVAQGDLHISGKGILRGTVITAGKLTYDVDVVIRYNKSTVTDIVQQLSYWQRAEKSWNDFKPL